MAASPEEIVALVVFARVVEAQSFTGAARILGLSKSVVSARIAELEDRLGTRLLHRTTRRLSLTAEGLALYERAAKIVAAGEEATAAAQAVGSEPRGVLRVSAPEAFGQHHLAEPIATFLARHPGVAVELFLVDRLVDLVAEGIDVAVRVSAGLRDSSLVGRKLADDRTVVCASPEYLERRGTPRAPAELLGHDCLRYALLKQGDEWRFRAGGPSFAVPVEARFTSASGAMLREAALAGIGIAVLPSFMVAPDVAAGRLTEVLAEFRFVRLAVHAVYPGGRAVSAKIRAFVEVLAAYLKNPPWAKAIASSPRRRAHR